MWPIFSCILQSVNSFCVCVWNVYSDIVPNLLKNGLFFLLLKESLTYFRYKSYSGYVIQIQSFVILHHIFRFMINLELIFVYDAKWDSRFIFFLHMTIQLFSHHLLKRLFLSYWIALVLWSKINWLDMCKPVSGLCIFFYWPVCTDFYSTWIWSCFPWRAWLLESSYWL